MKTSTSHGGNGGIDIEKQPGLVADTVVTSTPDTSSPTTEDDTTAESRDESAPTSPNGDIYDRFGRGRKRLFVTILSLCAIVSPISSTGSLTAVSSIAALPRSTSQGGML